MRESVRYIEVTLPASKTDSFQKVIELTIAASQDPACSVQAHEMISGLRYPQIL